MAGMNIPFLNRDEILKHAGDYPPEEKKKDEELRITMESAAERGHMTLNDLVKVADWKSPRIRNRCRDNNSEADVREVTKVSFAAKSEHIRIGVLRALHWVDWPMASTIMHFAFPDDGDEGYPILDFRAMRTVGGSTNYNFERWMEYTKLCRKVAKDYDVSMRTLDKALWTFDLSKDRGG